MIMSSMSSASHRLVAISTVALAATAAAVYLYFKFRKPKTVMNPDRLEKKSEVHIDSINRNVKKKRVSYCRCWKSKTFPLCDGAHKYHNRDNDDSTGPLVIYWDEDTEPAQATTLTDLTTAEGGGDAGEAGPSATGSEALSSVDDEMSRLDTSFISEMDVKSIDSDSPIHEAAVMSHFDGNSNSGSGSEEHMGSIEVIYDSEVKLINNPDNDDSNTGEEKDS